MTRRALGRGLSALLPDSFKQSDDLLEIEIDLIKPGAHQPRTHFREDRLQELAQSIRANGIVQPLVVRRRGPYYEIIAGERRWRAAQIAGLTKVPTIVRDVPDEKVLELALIENIQRQELNPMEEARAYQSLVNDLGLTQEEVAQRVGRERSSVTNYLRLLKLPPRIQNWVEEEQITMGHARALLAIEASEEQERLALQIIERKLSVRETEREIRRLVSGVKTESANQPANKTDANTRAAEERLKQRLGTQVRIVRKGEGGKIEIDFYSEVDLNRIYSLLMGRTTG